MSLFSGGRLLACRVLTSGRREPEPAAGKPAVFTPTKNHDHEFTLSLYPDRTRRPGAVILVTPQPSFQTRQLSPARLGQQPLTTRPTIRGKFIFKGEEKFLIKGVSYGAFRPDERKLEYWNHALIERDFALMAANGVNTVRIPHTMPPVSLLDTAEKHGLQVMVGLSAEQYVGYLIDEDKEAPDILGIVREKVRSVAGHPALLCYGIGNEIGASVARWLGGPKIERYLERIYRAVKEVDPDGLVTYVNYPSTEYLNLAFLDFLSFNVYLEQQDRLQVYLARLQTLAGDRPLLMSEVGLDAMRNGEEKQAEVLVWQVRTVFEAGCVGAVIFSWTDEWHRAGAEVDDWAFGITDRDRQAKPALAVVKRMYDEAPFTPRQDWPRISVVICSFNGEKTIRDTLSRTCALNYPNYEVIVIDDGSTDGTAAIARKFSCRLISQENRGLSAARTRGCEEATGEIVAYIDDDASPDPHWLYFLGHGFLTTSHVALGGPNCLPPVPRGAEVSVDRAPGGAKHVMITDELAEHIPGCNFAIRRDFLLGLGGFDPIFRAAGDDVDMCWRILATGETIGFVAGAVVWHHRRSGCRAYWKQQLGYGKAEALLEKKWPDKYNSAGHHTFKGRIYSNGVVSSLFRRSAVYHGHGGFAPFQSLYETSSGGIWSVLPLMPEWYLLILLVAGASLLGLLWTPLFLFAPLWIGALALTLIHATAEAWRAQLPGTSGGKSASRVKIAYLHLIQPLARLMGRQKGGLNAWRHRGQAGFVMPRSSATAEWTEDWQEPEKRLAQFNDRLVAKRNVVRHGSDYDRWDLEVLGGIFGSARSMMGVEDHGGGSQYVRLRFWPRLRQAARVLVVFLAILVLLAVLATEWLVASIFGIFLLLVLLAAFLQSGRALAALHCASHPPAADEVEPKMP